MILGSVTLGQATIGGAGLSVILPYLDLAVDITLASSLSASLAVLPLGGAAVGTRTYPPVINRQSNLFIAANNKTTPLASALAIDGMSLAVADASTWPTSGAVTLDEPAALRTNTSSEIIYFNGRAGNILTLTARAQGGTTAKAWASGKTAEMRVTAEHHNILADAIIAAETEIETKADLSALEGKAALVHVHEISDVTGLEAALDEIGDAQGMVVYNVREYGASPSASAATNRAAFQAAIDACPAFGTVWIPSVTGGYPIGGSGSELLLVTKNIHLLGEHAAGVNSTYMVNDEFPSSPATGGSVLIVDAAVGSSTDVIRIAGTTRHQCQKIIGIQICAASGTPARHALYLDLTHPKHWHWQMWIKHNWFATLGGRSIYLHNPTNTDGFFGSTISDNVIEAGMSLLRCGDSVWIMRNQFWGYGFPQSPATAIDLSTVSGAALITIRDNNCTAVGGFIRALSGEQLIIEGNQIEQTFATTMPESAMIALLGSTAAHTRSRIVGNDMNAHSGMATWNIRLGPSSDTEIHCNTIVGGSGVEIQAGATGTRLGYNPGAVYLNNGTDTKQISYVAL